MEPDNNQLSQIPQTQSESVDSAPVMPEETSVQNETPAKKTPVQMIIGLLDGIKKKLNKPKETTVTTDTGIPVDQETTVQSSDISDKKPKVSKRIIFIAIFVVVLLVVLALVASMISRNGGGSITQTPSASATPSPTPVTEVPSQYADDEDVAQIKAQMEDLNKSLNESSFRDETLRVPNLDWNVSFE